HYGISRTHLRRWIRAYQEGGIGALEHPQSKTMPQHRKNPFIADKPDQEKTQAELIEELCYMRAEVAYLKELKALSQKQTEKDKAKSRQKRTKPNRPNTEGATPAQIPAAHHKPAQKQLLLPPSRPARPRRSRQSPYRRNLRTA
ncbi:TPA: helix-turn-helix domain-containing protein, partial [Neisseria subflava]